MTKVHESQFELLTGSDCLAKYQWNTRIAQHYFCTRCGIYTFHRKRAQPDHYGINVYCLDDFDSTTVPVRKTEGISMSLVADNPRPEWPGPRVKTIEGL